MKTISRRFANRSGELMSLCIFAFALSLVVHVLSVAVAWCAAQSVDAPFPFWHALLLLPPVLLIASVPISIAGWGVRESALVLAFSYAGLPRSDGLIISVLFGVVILVAGLRAFAVLGPRELDILRRTRMPGSALLARWLASGRSTASPAAAGE